MLLYKRALPLDLFAAVSAWVGLRVAKRGRPPGYSAAFVRFYLVRRPFFSAAARDREVALHPFRRNP
jgi:hypothetical protein